MATAHATTSKAKTTTHTVNAGATQQDKSRPVLAQGVLVTDTGMQENTVDGRDEEPMEEGQQSDATPTGSAFAQQNQAQVPTSQAGATSEAPRPLPQPNMSNGPRVPGASGQPPANVHRGTGKAERTELPAEHNQEPRPEQWSAAYRTEEEPGLYGGNAGGLQQGSHGHFQERTQHGHDGHHCDGHVQGQVNAQLQRPLQASKQMAYQVFANVITAIEELENRECKKKRGVPAPERSKAFIPDQTFKNNEDVVAGVEAQLTVFQAHMGFCPKEISEQVKVEMIDTTLTWAAARHDLKLPQGKVDQYAVNLLEILYVGATQQTFSILKKSWRLLSGSELISGFRKIMQGQAKGMQLDKQFMEDPAKQAEALPIRQGKHISDGILRLMETAKNQKKPQLVKYLELHLESIGCAR